MAASQVELLFGQAAVAVAVQEATLVLRKLPRLAVLINGELSTRAAQQVLRICPVASG